MVFSVQTKSISLEEHGMNLCFCILSEKFRLHTVIYLTVLLVLLVTCFIFHTHTKKYIKDSTNILMSM